MPEKQKEREREYTNRKTVNREWEREKKTAESEGQLKEKRNKVKVFTNREEESIGCEWVDKIYLTSINFQNPALFYPPFPEAKNCNTDSEGWLQPPSMKVCSDIIKVCIYDINVFISGFFKSHRTVTIATSCFD